MSDGLLVQTMQRIMSVLDEIDERKADVKEIYGEAHSQGYDKAAIGVAIREIRGRAKAETPKAQERASVVELYVSAFDNAPRTYVHVPARGENVNAGRASSLSGNAAERTPDVKTQETDDVDRSASAQPHSAKGEPAIPSKAGDAGTGQAVCEPENAGIGQPSGAGTGSAVRSGAPVSETADPDSLPAAQNEAAASESLEQAAPESADGDGDMAGPAQDAEFVTPSGEGEGGPVLADPLPAAEAKAFKLPQPKPLRPNCLKPEQCAGYGSVTCFTCREAAKAKDDDDAEDVPTFVRKTHEHAAGDRA